MRKLLALVGLAVVAGLVVAPGASAAASSEDRCYTLGLPGMDHYEYCTHLPIDPSPR